MFFAGVSNVMKPGNGAADAEHLVVEKWPGTVGMFLQQVIDNRFC
jgi:hypothetical protein